MEDHAFLGEFVIGQWLGEPVCPVFFAGDVEKSDSSGIYTFAEIMVSALDVSCALSFTTGCSNVHCSFGVKSKQDGQKLISRLISAVK